MAALVLLALFIQFSYVTADQCLSTPVNTINEHRLNNASYKNITEESPITCMQTCQTEPYCLSVNYNLVSSLCELNAMNWFLAPKQLNRSAVHVYMERIPAKNPCSFRPCLYGGVCEFNEEELQLKCHCRGGFKGEHCEECESNDVGLAHHIIPDVNFKASSHDVNHPPSMARLNGPKSWIPSKDSANEYLEIILSPHRYHITKIAIEGDTDADYWVTSFKMQYANSNGEWKMHSKNPSKHQTVFKGPTSRGSAPTESKIRPAIDTTAVRILPQQWNTKMAIRLELYGCKISVE